MPLVDRKAKVVPPELVLLGLGVRQGSWSVVTVATGMMSLGASVRTASTSLPREVAEEAVSTPLMPQPLALLAGQGRLDALQRSPEELAVALPRSARVRQPTKPLVVEVAAEEMLAGQEPVLQGPLVEAMVAAEEVAEPPSMARSLEPAEQEPSGSSYRFRRSHLS